MENIFTQEDFLKVVILAIPLVIGGVLHMVVVKTNTLSYFKKPIHQRSFGENKTWRGFIVMPLATYPGVILAQQVEKVSDLSAPLISSFSPLLLSLVLGIFYCLAELPNSFIKRKLGIRPGETAEKNRFFFVVMDQMDSVLGCLAGYRILIPIGFPILLGALILGTLVHLIINNVLYLMGLRKNPL